MADTATTALPTTYLTPTLYDTIQNKTFLGLVIAEFLAAFNDQCIHASAMFFAIRKEVLDERTAIALMPLLFYCPWAIFATLSGYLADKVSKRRSLIFWKVAEVFITALALLGFWLGATFDGLIGQIGPWLVMSCVFFMGTHSTFYVPCKYGVLPELFTVRSLSRANGLVESTTFLAVILGTTCGGILSKTYRGEEQWIGVILVILALIGTGTSYFIRQMPPADPNRPFPGWVPWKLFRPLFVNLRTLMRYRLSSIAVLGLAFFVFMVAFMRATMYMFGESQNPRWDEQQTSMMVAVVSLGVGLGSPLAGFMSRGKVELGLVAIGALGMVLGAEIAGVSIFAIPALVACLALMGLFAAFYLVPLYSLLQYSAPKGSKGTSVATSNFICTIGAILASLVFWSVGHLAEATGISQRLETVDEPRGKIKLEEKVETQDHRVEKVVLLVTDEAGTARVPITSAGLDVPRRWELVDFDAWEWIGLPPPSSEPNDIRLLEGVHEGSWVKVSKYTIRGIDYYQVRLEDRPQPVNFNKEYLPRYLFMTEGVLMLGVITVLCARQRDMLLRSLIWLRQLGRPAFRINGYENLPTTPTILVTNVRGRLGCLPLVSALVRPLRFVLPADDEKAGPLVVTLENYAGLIFFDPNAQGAELQKPGQAAANGLKRGKLVVISTAGPREQFEALLTDVQTAVAVPVVPVTVHEPTAEGQPITIGSALPEGAGADLILAAIQQQLLTGEPAPPPGQNGVAPSEQIISDQRGIR